MKNLIIALTSFLIATTSCCSDKDNVQPAANTLRTLSYEVTGNFSGNLYVSYTTASGSTNNEHITSLPWNKEITFNTNVTAATIVLSGSGGTVGQKVTLIAKKGGTVIGNPVVATAAGASGSFSTSVPVVVF